MRRLRHLPVAAALISVLLYSALVTSHIVSQATHRALPAQGELLTGIKTPTGETGERDEQDELFEAEFQPGSGSWDPMLGLALSQAQGRWSVDGNVLYTMATEGTQHTDLGDRFHYNGAVTFRLKGGDAEISQRSL